MTIGEKISTRRKELKLTLEDVGNAVGVGKSTVKKWESGYIANMRRDKIAALSKVLQINPAEFINSDTENDLTSCSNECNFFKNCHNRETVQFVSLFLKLDTLDRGRAIGNIEEMLKAPKYTAEKESSNEKAG